jgi:hypothetical protein
MSAAGARARKQAVAADAAAAEETFARASLAKLFGPEPETPGEEPIAAHPNLLVEACRLFGLPGDATQQEVVEAARGAIENGSQLHGELRLAWHRLDELRELAGVERDVDLLLVIREWKPPVIQ